MKKIINLNRQAAEKLLILKDLPLLFLRLILAYGFISPALMKVKNIDNIISWFNDMGIPFPAVNAYLAGYTELIGAIFLAAGFSTRLISVPLMAIMLVAIKTVHWENGFEAGNNGYEIPLYYLIMLFTLMIYGSGKWSIDYLLHKKSN